MATSGMLDVALARAREGFRVFPCVPGGKIPAVKDWPNRATRDPLSVAELWAEHGENCNVGIACGGGIAAVDVDCRGGKRGFDSLTAMPPIPDTRTTRTPTAGAHLLFRLPEGVRVSNSAGALADGVDIRGDGGYVLAPGSVVGGKPYVLAKDLPIADAPDWLLAKLTERRVGASAPAGAMLGAEDTPEAIERAKTYVASAAPAIDGEGGDHQTYKVCVRLRRDFNLSVETALEVLEPWNDRCLPPWDLGDLTKKLENAGQYGQNLAGTDSPLVGFAPIEAPPPPLLKDLLEFPEDMSLDEVLRQGANALIKGVLNPNEDAVLYGRSGTGKTFVALDMGYALAQGRSWAGCKTRKCAVLYVGLEGSGGVQKRFKALQEKFGTADRCFARSRLHVSLIKGDAGATGARTIVEAFNALLAASGAETGLIIIDTLARAIAGDNENDSSDMAAFIEHRMAKIRATANGHPAVLAVHHTNKEGGMRGSGVLRGNVDVILRAEREEDEKGYFSGGARSLFAEKVKDGEEQKLFDYELEKVVLGHDSDGDAVTTCLVAVVTDPEAEQIFQCEVLVRRLMTEKLSAGGKLSPSPHTGRDKATGEERYAAKWLHANGAGAHSVKRIQSVLDNGLASLFPIIYSEGAGPAWYSLLERTVSSESVPVQPASTRFSEKPIPSKKQSKINDVKRKVGSKRESVRA